MCAQFNPPDSRDRAIARAVARAVRSSQTDGPGKGPLDNDACPDASLVAAYADQALADSERAHLENHFAACERCRQTLAALGVAIEGADVAVMPAPVAARPQPAPPKRWLWWLSPAFGAAAAGLLWMFLRPPAPAPVQTAANYSTSDAQESRARSAPAAPSAASEPPASAAAPRRDAQALDSVSKTAAQAKESAANATPRNADEFAAPSNASAMAAPPQPAPRAEIAGALGGSIGEGTGTRGQTNQASAPAAPSRPVPQAATVPGNQTQTATATEELPFANTRNATLGGTLSSQTVADLPMTARAAAQRTIHAYTFDSPEGGAQWRLGTAGLIEKSADTGQTWQQQPSGVTVDLLAGSAASNQAAWIVGRAGVILRTTNGQQWQRIPAPAGITDDWVNVVVRSATSATVVGPIRRFSTEDGGIIWTEQK